MRPSSFATTKVRLTPRLWLDNAHDGHHRHYLGAVEPVDFVSFEDTEERFQQDWIALKDRK